MSGNRKTFFATPEDAEAAFYEAIERADLDALMAIWAEDEEIVFVPPGGMRLAGYPAIRDAWQQIFAGGMRLHIRIHAISAIVNPFTAIHSVIEQVVIEGENTEGAPIVATNIFLRGPLGWRLAVHHASAAPPDSTEPAKTLH